MLRFILHRDYFRSIPEGDYMSSQRYILFVLFSIITFFTGVILFCILDFVYHLPGFLVYLMPVLSVTAVVNYLAFQKHKNRIFAYSFLIAIAVLIIHVFIYFTGGIYAPANFYLLALAVTTFMLLGKRAGWIYLAVACLHLIWAFYATTQTHLISNYHDGNPGNMEGDIMMSAIICISVISFHCMSLAKSTDVILSAMNQTNLNLQESFSKLETVNNNLAKSNRELDKFAYVVSHDLKAPLRAMGSLSSWIQEEIEEDNKEAAINNLQTLKGRVARMENLINGILEYSKLNKSRQMAENLHTAEIINECVSLLQPPRNFRINVQGDQPVVFGEKIKLQQIFLNLISNAIKYNDKEEGFIRISSSERSEFWEFSVTDNGPGIEEQYFEKIFVIFQTLQARDTFESTGVGLAIVKKIVEDQGGSIRIQSVPGLGASFIFTIPKLKPLEQEKPGSNLKLAS